jgi:hypothetical protein
LAASLVLGALIIFLLVVVVILESFIGRVGRVTFLGSLRSDYLILLFMLLLLIFDILQDLLSNKSIKSWLLRGYLLLSLRSFNIVS